MQISLTEILDLMAGQTALQVCGANAAIAREIENARVAASKELAKPASVRELKEFLLDSARQTARQQGLAIASRWQQLLLWEMVINRARQRTDGLQSLDARALAPQALLGWQRLKNWQLPMQQLAALEQYSELQFAPWCDEFEQRLEANQLTTVELALQATPETGKNRLLLVTAGSDISPLDLHFLKKCFEQVQIVQLATGKCRSFRCRQPDRDSELHAAACWAAAILDKDAKARIAIIRTELDLPAETWIRETQRMLARGQALRSGFTRPLRRGALPAASLLLQLNRSQLALSQARAILQSPFWGQYPHDFSQRSAWETRICGFARRQLKRRQLINCAREAAVELDLDRTADLSHRLQALVDLADKFPARQSLQQWAQCFSQQLDSLGWPGKRLGGEEAERARETWLEVCRELTTLDRVSGEVNLSRALSLLDQVLAGLQIAPDATGSGVNLLDTIESAVGFEYIWLMGADNSRWPGASQPHSLIPVALQIERGMPRADAKRELTLCQQLLRHLEQNCQQLCFSICSDGSDEGVDFSPLLPDCEDLTLSIAPANPIAGSWQWVDCATAPPLAPSTEHTRGGAGLINSMLASPFSAFARYRLEAKPLPKPGSGISAALRGTLVHRALEYFWKDIEGSEALQKMSSAELHNHLDHCCQRALGDKELQAADFPAAYLQSIHRWLIRLLDLWVSIEKERGPFTVKALESFHEISVGPLVLNLKIDRIDQAADGRLILIDYKTGNATFKSTELTQSPPANAQLPLYSLCIDEALAAVVIANVRLEKAAIKGMGPNPQHAWIEDVTDWDSMREQWRRDLAQVAADFAAGECAVWEAPKSFGYEDELASLHRFDEYQELMDWYGSQG